MTNHGGSDNEALGIALKILSGVCFAVMTAMVKYLDSDIPLGQVVFFRSAAALIPLVIFLLLSSEFPAGLYTKHPWKHVSRCFLGTLAMFFAFATLRYLPIAEATAINYLSPVILVLLSIFLLKEQVSTRRWLGVILGVCGLAVLIVPNFSAQANGQTLLGIALAITSAVLIAAALLQIRQMSKMGENAGTIAFYFALTSTIIGAITLLGDWQTPTAQQWFLLIAIGLIGGIAQISMTLAFKYAEASAMAPYDYLSIIWAVVIGVVVFADVPNAAFWIAMPLILCGAVIAKPKTRKTTNKYTAPPT